jgi:hypothetical protein
MLLHEIEGPEPEPSMKVIQGTPPEEPLNEKIGFEVRKKKVYYKKILERGSGWDKPGEDDEITMRIADVTNSLEDYGEARIYRKSDLFPSFFRAIRELKKGEKSQIHIPGSMNDGVPKIFRVHMIDWVQCTHLPGGMIKRVKIAGKDVSLARRDECKMDLKITQGESILYQIEDWYNRIEVFEVGSGVAEILRAMKKFETSVTQVGVEYFKEHFKQYVTGDVSDEDVFVEITIKKFLKYHDVTLDCTFFKCELVDGTGDRTLPNNNSRVKVFYRYIIEGEIVATNWDQEPVEFYMDEDDVPTLWINCSRQMKSGDVYKVECDLTLPKSTEMSDGLLPQYHFAQYQRPGVQYAYFYIKNLGFVIGRPNNLLSLDERLQESRRVKLAGDKFFKIEKFDRAYDKYKAATNFVEPVNDDEDNFKQQLIILYRNMSLCNFKSRKFLESTEDADKVLALSPGDVKALYRKALARKELRNYQIAIEELKKAIELVKVMKDESSLKLFNAELLDITRLNKEMMERERELYLGIFDKQND